MNTTLAPVKTRPRRGCTHHLRTFDYKFHSQSTHLLPLVDRAIPNNREFTYQLLKADDGRPARKLTLLLHGLNEKNWDKYWSWGESICRETGSAVLFFPIAFHMQRAPENWSNSREMFRLSEYRRKNFEGVQGSSLSNAAISTRIHEEPGRLIWSGLESYYDVIQLLRECREGQVNQLNREFSLNLFGYSIGGFLAELLKLSNPGGIFSNSKVCLFCSGPVFNCFSPVSRYILDSKAHSALENFLAADPGGKLTGVDERVRSIFLSLLDYNILPEFREELLKKYASDFYAIVLKKDEVIPAPEVFRTLCGADGSTGIRVDEFDFPYSYGHENPFVAKDGKQEDARAAFREVFQQACNFLKN